MLWKSGSSEKEHYDKKCSGPNTGKYGPERNSYFDTFHTVVALMECELF